MNNFNDAKKEAKVSKIPSNVSLKHLKEPNIDTLTYPKVVGTNNKLATALKVKNALEFGKYFTFLNAALKPEDVKKIKNNKFDNLLFTNKKILAVLKKIEEHMIDEQDTSIKHKSKDSKNQTVIENVIVQNAHDENGLGLGLGLIPKFKTPKFKTPKEKTPKEKTQKVEDKSKVKPTKTPEKTNVEDKQGKPIKEVEASKKPVNEQNVNKTEANKTNVNKTEANSQPTAKEGANESNLNKLRKFIPKTARVLARGASLVGTGIVIGEGVYQYINAECDGDRMDAIASTTGALAGMAAGAKIGALAGVWAGPLGMAAGALVGAGLGALAGSALGEWISGKLKTPLDFIPDKFKNRGPKIEYAYIETKLLPLVNNMPYESTADYNKAFDSVEKRMIELVEEMKKAPTEEQQKEWDKNKLINDDILTDNWEFTNNSIKDWKKVENLSDSDLDILINDANLNNLDKDRVREIKFMRNAKTNTNAQTAVSAIDRVNQAIEAERKRLEEYRKENTFDSFSGVEIESDNYRRSLKTIKELQQVKRTMLSQAEKGDYKSIEVDEKSRDINNNSVKQFNSLTLQNTSSAEFFASKNLNADSFKTQWATNFSKRADISSDVIRDFNSIKAQDIQFNTSDHLGFVSGEFESGGNPGTVAKDNFGYAYGAWQMNSKKGILPKFVESLKGDPKFGKLAELEIDSPEFQKEWASLAKQYPNEFLKKQHECISKNLFMPVFNYAKSAGINVTNRAVQEALWSQAVQHGLSGNKKIIDAAASKLSPQSKPEDIVRALYSARSNYINGLSTLDSDLKEQLNSRYRKETSKALGVASNSDYQNSEVTKNVASDNFDGSNVDIETISEEKNKATEIEKNVSLVQDLAKVPGNETTESTEKSSDSTPILNVVPTKRDNVEIQDINENNIDNVLMMKAAENANTQAQTLLNLPSLNMNKNSETSERDSFDLTTPTIPFVY